MGQIASLVFNLILIFYGLLSNLTCETYLSIFTCCIANIKFSSCLFMLYINFYLFLFCFLVKIKNINEWILLNGLCCKFTCGNWFLSQRTANGWQTDHAVRQWEKNPISPQPTTSIIIIIQSFFLTATDLAKGVGIPWN